MEAALEAVKKMLTKLFDDDDPVHEINDLEELTKELQDPQFQANARDEQGNTPLHLLVKRSFKKRKLKRKAELIVCMLTYSSVDMEIPDNTGNTPLHTAVKAGEIEVVKVFVAFNASINAINNVGKTPLDLTLPSSVSPEDSVMVKLLVSCGAKHSDSITPPKLCNFSKIENQRGYQDKFAQELARLEANLKENAEKVLTAKDETPGSAKELARLITKLETLKKAGARVLCLDGGGIRGLIQMEVLSQLERATGKKVTELFDWIIGTSTGGVVALSLVYAQKTLHEMRQFYLRTRFEVFGNTVLGMKASTDALIHILQTNLDGYCMSDVKTPKVLVCAVDKSTASLKFRFFNNCFDDDYSTQEVWKVARYTCAAPTIFKEMDDFVDGGLLAQNPSTLGIARIQEYYQAKGQTLPVSLVVSIGSGVSPDRELGSLDAQDFLMFGSHWFDEEHPKKISTLRTVLTNALVSPFGAHYNTMVTCDGACTPYFRFNPDLSKAIKSGETDFDKLLTMMLDTKSTPRIGEQIQELIKKLHKNVETRAEYLQRFGESN